MPSRCSEVRPINHPHPAPPPRHLCVKLGSERLPGQDSVLASVFSPQLQPVPLRTWGTSILGGVPVSTEGISLPHCWRARGSISSAMAPRALQPRLQRPKSVTSGIRGSLVTSARAENGVMKALGVNEQKRRAPSEHSFKELNLERSNGSS